MRGHWVDWALGAVVAAWLGLVLVITRSFSFWSDDLFLIEQAGSWRGLLRPYNDHLSLVILGIYRAAAEVGGFSYWPFVLVGALSLVAVPVAFYLTTRSRLGPVWSALAATVLLWFPSVNLRSSSLNHYLVLLGAVACAAALNRGRRADGVLLAGLALALCSAGGGVVVAGACVVHNLLVRPPVRRWVVVAIPSLAWVVWRLLVSDEVHGTVSTSTGSAVRAVRDLVANPFDAAALGVGLLAAALAIAFVVVGFVRLRDGLRAGANFIAWSLASVAWAVALVQSRGPGATGGQFRYTYLSMGFALLALVPARPTSSRAAVQRPVFAALVLLLGLGRALVVVDDMQDFARAHAERGREAEGTMLVLSLGPAVIPDDAPISFFDVLGNYGTAGQLRTMIDRYGDAAPRDGERVDRELVERRIVRTSVGDARTEACEGLTAPFTTPGVADHAFGVRPGPPTRLWSAKPFPIEVRRYGSDWVEVTQAPAGREVTLTLPALNDDEPWQVRAPGACVQ